MAKEPSEARPRPPGDAPATREEPGSRVVTLKARRDLKVGDVAYSIGDTMARVKCSPGVSIGWLSRAFEDGFLSDAPDG